jgi:hypothetical protein
MQVVRTLSIRTLFVVAVAVAPLAFAIPAQAQGDDQPTYTCDQVGQSNKSGLSGKKDRVIGVGCEASNGAPTRDYSFQKDGLKLLEDPVRQYLCGITNVLGVSLSSNGGKVRGDFCTPSTGASMS